MSFIRPDRTLDSASAVSRRGFLQAVAGGSALLLGQHSMAAMSPSQHAAHSNASTPVLHGPDIDLVIDHQLISPTGKATMATLVNGSLPAPTLRFKEGDTVTIRVSNRMNVPTSIHWHGILLPYQMDGVPAISFDGIAAGTTFTYRFTLKQHGTYWYHAHSGFQEQTGLFGALIIDPKDGPSHQVDREHTILLSDWTTLDPVYLLSKLKKHSDFDNHQQPTVQKLLADIEKMGLKNALQQRKMWNQMRMSPTDFTDLSASSLDYLINGQSGQQPWFGAVNSGETVLLRLINGSAQTIFDLRIPDLKLTVIAADGQAVEPVTVDELRLAVAETYDVLIQPKQDAYTMFAQNIDRSGCIHATLAASPQLHAPIPSIDPPEWLTMTDMMGAMHGDHSDHGTQGAAKAVNHAKTEYGISVDMRVDMPRRNLDDAGVNLRDHFSKYGRRVLTYADLHTIGGSEDTREPSREIELHLTGNMERYIWGIDGLAYEDAPPVHVGIGERVRVRFVNDTMMTHPMHLHGMWSEIRQPNGDFQVRKHTVMVQPAQEVSFDLTGIEGRWAWHCHLLYHMQSGMMREMVVA